MGGAAKLQGRESLPWHLLGRQRTVPVRRLTYARVLRRNTRSGPTCLDTPGNTSPWASASLSPHAAGVAWITRGASSAFRDRRRRDRGERGPVVTSARRSPPRRPTAWAEPANLLRAT